MHKLISLSEDFPPPGFVAVDSAVKGVEVYKLKETEEASTPDVINFKCPQCFATTAYSVADGGLRCAHCGYYEAPKHEVIGKSATEFEFTVETMSTSAAAQGWGEVRKTLRCQSCQALTSLPAGQLTLTCPFCGSTHVLHEDSQQTMLRPSFIIPFTVTEDACQEIAREWLGSSWMTPHSLKTVANMAQFHGIYLPYWTFDAKSEAHWRAQVGHQVTERHYDASSKSWQTRTVTEWRWESGHIQRIFDDILVSGTTSLSHILLERVQNFDTHGLVPYDATFLAGFLAQAYDTPLERTWTIARDIMREETRIACRNQASTSQIRQFTMSLDFANESWRYVLLPIYIAVYRYDHVAYQVMVNGQTGAITGQKPVDWTKVWLAAIGMVLPGLLLGLLGLTATALGTLIPPSLVAGGAVLILAFILFVIGVIWAVATVLKARSMDDV